MAIYSGTYTNPDDLLSKIRTAVTTDGWTENAYVTEGSGYKLHIQKTINSVVYYLNFRSLNSEFIPPSGNEFTVANAIMMNQSLGYSAGAGSLNQSGAPPTYSGSGQGGGINCDSGSYYIFSSDEYIGVCAQDSLGEWSVLINYTLPILRGWMSSYLLSDQTSFNSTQSFMRVQWSVENYSSTFFYSDGTTLCPLSKPNDATGGYRTKTFFGGQDEGLVPYLVQYSPNDNIGIPVLAPLAVFVKNSAGERKHCDGSENIYFLNMKYLASEDTILAGTYRVFKVNYDQDYGVAFKIS